MTETADAAAAIEAILFVAEEPVPTQDLAQLLEMPSARVEEMIEDLSSQLAAGRRGLVVRQVGGGWRMQTHPSTAPFLERFVEEHGRQKLTQAALETLAVIAYRQPVSRAQIAEIRGVSSDSALRTLVVRGLVEETGRDPGPGQAVLYGTTADFLERMGLDSTGDLPPLPGMMPSTEEVERMERGLGPGI